MRHQSIYVYKLLFDINCCIFYEQCHRVVQCTEVSAFTNIS